MRNIFAKFIDSVTILAATFVLMFAWVRFYTQDITTSAIVGTVCAGVICFLVNFFADRSERKKIGSMTEKKSAEALGISLLGATNAEVLNYFETVFAKIGKSIKKQQNYLEMEYYSAQNELHSTLHSTIIYPFFHKATLGYDDLILIIKLTRTLQKSEVRVYCILASTEAKSLAKKIKNLDIQIYDQYDLYALGKDTPAPITIDTKVAKMGFADYIKFAFDKSRARNYLLFGLILLATSFIVPYKIYYLIMGSTLCLTSLAVRIFPLIKKR